MKIALVGANGNVAGRALNALVRAGAHVIALVRYPEKLSQSVRAKVQVEQGALEDEAFVVRATRAADALLWLTPGTLVAEDFRNYTLGLAQNAARAIRDNQIQRVVFISSHGADRPGYGHVSFAGEVEQVLEAAAPHTVSLRSAGYMENLLGSIDALKKGHYFGVLPPDKPYPLVASRDVGDLAAICLLDANLRGHRVRGVHGPVDLTARNQAEIMSSVLGKSIRYQQIPAEALREAFLKRGATESVAASYFELFNSFAQDSYRPSEARTPATTTPTTFETFVRESLTARLGA